jgi:LemA protein
MMIYLLLGILAALVLWVISTYNFFVSTKTRVGASIQEIGNQLKRQAELIPNLENSVKGYLAHEKGIMEMLSDARKMVAKGQDASKKISELLPKLQVVVESNPQLQGATVVTNLMNDLRDTSDKVMYARRLLIDLTADYNVKRVTVPSSFVANMFHFETLKGLETPEEGDFTKVSDSDTKTPKISL